MPRKKIAKRVNNKAASVATAAQMEKDFSSMPAKLASEMNRELAALKKKQGELKKAVSHTVQQLKATGARIKLVSKGKKTATSKKQLAAAKKALQEATKIHRSLVKELEIIGKQVNNYIQKVAKIKALSKAMSQFNKEWAKQAKNKKKAIKVKAKSKTKAKTKRKSTIAPQLKAVDGNEAGTSNIDSMDDMSEETTQNNRSTEMTS